jgi:hypothetical protein
VLASLGVDPLVEVVDDGGKGLLGFLVQVGNGDSGGENGIIGVLGREVGSSLGREVLGLAELVALEKDSRRARRW